MALLRADPPVDVVALDRRVVVAGDERPGAAERVLRPHDDAKAVARYILQNPIRSGLARAAEEYPFLGSDVWSLEELLDSVR